MLSPSVGVQENHTADDSVLIVSSVQEKHATEQSVEPIEQNITSNKFEHNNIAPSFSEPPVVSDFLGTSYKESPPVYCGSQHEQNLFQVVIEDISDKILTIMQQLDNISSGDSLLALRQTIQKNGGLRMAFKEELYRQEKAYQQVNGSNEKCFQLIDYVTDREYGRLKGLYRPLVALKIDEFYPSENSFSLEERTYQRASIVAFRHFSKMIQSCDTIKTDIAIERFLFGYWKYEARTEVSRWLSEQITSASSIYEQCQEIISSAITAQEEAYSYLVYRKTLEIEKRLGRHLLLVTESEEHLLDGAVCKRILKDDGTWRIEMYDPPTLETLEEEDDVLF